MALRNEVFLPSLKSCSCRFCYKIPLLEFILTLEVLRKSGKCNIAPDEDEEGLVCGTCGCQSALHQYDLDKFKRGTFYRNAAFVKVIFVEDFILLLRFGNLRIFSLFFFFIPITRYLDTGCS